MKRPEPQQTLGLRVVGKKGLDAYEVLTILSRFLSHSMIRESSSVRMMAGMDLSGILSMH